MNNETKTNFHYDIEFSVDTSAIVPAVKQTLDSVNGIMNEMGFSEKLVARTTLPITISSNRKLTKEEEQKLIEAATQSFSNSFGPSVKFETLRVYDWS